jgi:protein-S-isoprenylcysteine O-methyltransferase Ste14
VNSTHANTPHVILPPPVPFVSALLLGIVLDRVLPIAVAPASALPFLQLAGLLLTTASGSLAAAAFFTLRRHRTTFRTDRPVEALVTAGPFRLTRNPMYLSLALLLVAVSAFLNSPWPIAFLVPALVLVQRLAIRPEERYLLKAYGNEYERYCRKVRRWV